MTARERIKLAVLGLIAPPLLWSCFLLIHHVIGHSGDEPELIRFWLSFGFSIFMGVCFIRHLPRSFEGKMALCFWYVPIAAIALLGYGLWLNGILFNEQIDL